MSDLDTESVPPAFHSLLVSMHKIELYYQVAMSRLADQDHRNQKLELKASGVLAISITLVGIASLTVKDATVWTVVPGLLFAVAFAGTVWFALRALRVREWDRGPRLQTLAGHLVEYDDETLTEWVADEIERSVRSNELHHHSKSSICKPCYERARSRRSYFSLRAHLPSNRSLPRFLF